MGLKDYSNYFLRLFAVIILVGIAIELFAAFVGSNRKATTDYSTNKGYYKGIGPNLSRTAIFENVNHYAAANNSDNGCGPKNFSSFR